MQKIFKSINSEQVLFFSSVAVVIFSILASFPSLAIWLGLPPEGDAVDYRVSLVRYLASEWKIPNWRFTFIDDYPMFGEILFAVLYSIHPNLMRMLPILSYIGIAYWGGKFFMEYYDNSKISNKTLFWIGMAWVLALRPVGIQSNLLMLDNFCAFLMLGSFYFLFKKRIVVAGLFFAFALASRYSAWSVAPAFAVFAFLQGENWRRRIQFVFQFSLISFLGAAPFIFRNYQVNGNPFYPLFTSFFNGVSGDIAYFIYGRGTDLVSFLLLPFDMLYTNSFKQAYFDYSLGKLFYLQLLIFVVCLIWEVFSGRAKMKKTEAFSILVFSFLFLVLWFKGSQQMRFFVPLLVLINIAMLGNIARNSSYWLLSGLTLIGIFSVLSIQKDSVLMFLGKKEGIFESSRKMAEECFMQIPENEPVGYIRRDGMLGFFDRPFVFVAPHPYVSPGYKFDSQDVMYIYTTEKIMGYEPWPEANPCLVRRVSSS